MEATEQASTWSGQGGTGRVQPEPCRWTSRLAQMVRNWLMKMVQGPNVHRWGSYCTYCPTLRKCQHWFGALCSSQMKAGLEILLRYSWHIIAGMKEETNSNILQFLYWTTLPYEREENTRSHSRFSVDNLFSTFLMFSLTNLVPWICPPASAVAACSSLLWVWPPPGLPLSGSAPSSVHCSAETQAVFTIQARVSNLKSNKDLRGSFRKASAALSVTSGHVRSIRLAGERTRKHSQSINQTPPGPKNSLYHSVELANVTGTVRVGGGRVWLFFISPIVQTTTNICR